jgi:hypothetical protein
MDEQTKERVAKNEALFRDVNERVKEIDDDHRVPTEELWDFLCECGEADCLERVSLTRADYERVRANAVQFVIVPGHETPEVERVVAETPRFAIVEKKASEQSVALNTDPRA